MRLQYYLFMLFLLLGRSIYAQQDPQFTQFYSNPLYQAPSFAGAIKGYRAALNYRDQWPSIPGQVTTATFALDYNLSALNSGLGIIIMQDKIGTSELTNLNAGILYSYNVKVNRKIFFRPGVGFFYTQRSLNYSNLLFPSDKEGATARPILESEISGISAVDASVSGLLFVSNLWMGFTADHLITPNLSFTDRINRLPVKYTVYGGYRFYKVERLIGTKRQSITVVGTYKHQGSSDQLDIGLYWSYEPIMLGVWYRDLPFIKKYSRRDALAFLVGYRYQDLSVGYSYDFTLSRLITNTGGAHEISLIYKFEIDQRKKFKPIPCPEF